MQKIEKYEADAMLRLPSEERDLIAQCAGELAKSFDALEQVDTGDAEPLVSVLDTHTVLREDVAEKNITRAALMQTAPAQHEGYYQVPGTLE